MELREDLQLYKGIFWIVDLDNMRNNRNYCFTIPSDLEGNPVVDDLELNAKSGTNYNHKLLWDKLGSRNTHNKPYNYYPRGRVEIHNGAAKIFLNGNINTDEVIDFITNEFNLYKHNGIKKVQVIEDNSAHYLCHLDEGYKGSRR